jgi:hypothetical protein
MNIQQAKNIVVSYKNQHGFDTLRKAFDDMCVYKHKLPINEFVAVDIINRGHSDYAHLVK